MIVLPLILLLGAALLLVRQRSRPDRRPPVPACAPPRWRSWWPLPVCVAAGALAGAVLHAVYPASGHAVGHLGSAGTAFPVLVALGVVVWAVPRHRRGAELWLLAAALVAGAAVAVAGNLRVVEAVGGETWTDEAAGALGASRPGFESGHDLAGQGMLILVGAAAVLAVALVARRLVSGPVAIGAVLLSALFPPWIVPGAGLPVLAVALVRRRQLTAATAGAGEGGLTIAGGGRIGWPGGRSVRDEGVRARGGPAGVRPESPHRG